jgi:hypothetical protein
MANQVGGNAKGTTKTQTMTHYDELTKEQLIAELAVKDEKLKYYRTIEDHAKDGVQLSPQELSARLAIAEAKLAVFEEQKRREEKKREFERRLVEATDFLKANGYEVRQMTSAERFPVMDVIREAAEPKLKTYTGPITKTPEGGWPPLDPNTMEGRIFAGKPERIWRDEDMINFATVVFYRGPNEAKQLLEDYSNRKNKKP